MPSVRALEDLIIDAIYAGVLRGKLDQAAAQLHVEYTLGRDIEPTHGAQALLNSLQEW
jgi:COP9 signalosome complex subunit 7